MKLAKVEGVFLSSTTSWLESPSSRRCWLRKLWLGAAAAAGPEHVKVTISGCAPPFLEDAPSSLGLAEPSPSGCTSFFTFTALTTSRMLVTSETLLRRIVVRLLLARLKALRHGRMPDTLCSEDEGSTPTVSSTLLRSGRGRLVGTL